VKEELRATAGASNLRRKGACGKVPHGLKCSRVVIERRTGGALGWDE